MFPAAPPPSGLFGRESELARLVALYEAACHDGRGRSALVTGPPGVGKTRLMTELRRALRVRGEMPLEGIFRATDHRPHGPLVDLLGRAASFLSDLRRPAPATARALNLVAGLAEEPAGGALAFYEAVRQAVLEVSEVHPTVLFLHDLHRADTELLNMVRYLLENLLTDPAFDWTAEVPDLPAPGPRPFRGLLVLSFRETDATRPLMEVALASAAVDHLALTGLDSAGVAAFLASPAVVERFRQASGGLPVALEQMVSGLPDDGDDVWRRRLAGISEEARPLLDALAVYRRPCTAEQLRELSGVEADPRPTLTALVKQSVVEQAVDHGVVRFRFVRAGGRSAYARSMPQERTRALHLRVAERLTLAAGLGTEPEEIAHHYLAGGAEAEAVPFAVQAADRLQTCFGHARAARLLERVVDAASGDLQADLLDRLAALYAAAGQVDAARAAVRRLAERFPERAGPALEVRLARLHAAAADHASARAVAVAALEAGAPESARRALTAIAAEGAYQTGDLTGAKAYEDTLDEGGDRDTLTLRNTLGKVHLLREELEQARALFATNLERSRAAQDTGHQARALINLGVVHLQHGDQGAALQHFEEARRLAAAAGDLRHLALSVENLAVLNHRRQAYAEALVYHHQSTAAFRRLGHTAQLATTALNLADLYLTVGDGERARRLADIAREHVRRGELRLLLPQSLMLDGDLARAEGDLGAASRGYEEAIELIERGQGNNQRLASLLCSKAEVLTERGEPEGAAALLEQAATLPIGHDDALAARQAMTRGIVALARGDTAEAIAELEGAATRATDAGDQEVAWQALARLAEARWAASDRPATLQALAAAVEATERVAADLPESMRPTYHEAPRRRAVRDALRRVRAGMPPRGPVAGTQPKPKRRAAGFDPAWSRRYPGIIGRAPSLAAVFNTLDRVANSDSMVLVRGESGTGKELVASALHQHSRRAQGPFVKVNCSAFVETLLLSELFGHEKGAFTGAVSSKKGRFELADTGTLFLDEIGDISPNTQVALLRVLQERRFERVGGQVTLSVDVRVVCATHRNLEQMVRDGTFRADLYYRLRGVILEVPALRERREDIPALVEHFLQSRPNAASRPLRFSHAALASLLQHEWPGNVRELENVVRSVALFADGDTIDLAELAELGDIFRPPDESALLDLSEVLTTAPQPRAPESDTPAPESDSIGQTAPAGRAPPAWDDEWIETMLQEAGSLSDLKKRIEFEAIARALREAGGNITRAAAHLGMKRPRLSQIIHATPALGDLKREVTGQ